MEGGEGVVSALPGVVGGGGDGERGGDGDDGGGDEVELSEEFEEEKYAEGRIQPEPPQRWGGVPGRGGTDGPHAGARR